MLANFIDFIGFAFLCGTGLGVVLTLVLMAIGKATPQRTKWAVLGSAFSTTTVAVAVILYFVLSPKPEQRLMAKFDTLPSTDSTLLYEYGDTSSSATGQCIGIFQDYWYGTALSSEDVINLYSDYFSKNGWNIRPEEVVKIWSQETDDGLYRTVIDVFADQAVISQEQGYYRLPDSVLLEATHYQTVYLLSMTYMSPLAAKRCFGN
jgi:hypothetical protein